MKYSPYQELDFLQKKAMKGISVPKPHSAPVGFPQEKKSKLLQTLGDILSKIENNFGEIYLPVKYFKGQIC